MRERATTLLVYLVVSRFHLTVSPFFHPFFLVNGHNFGTSSSLDRFRNNRADAFTIRFYDVAGRVNWEHSVRRQIGFVDIGQKRAGAGGDKLPQ